MKGAENKLRTYLTEFQFTDIATAEKQIDWEKVPRVKLGINENEKFTFYCLWFQWSDSYKFNRMYFGDRLFDRLMLASISYKPTITTVRTGVVANSDNH